MINRFLKPSVAAFALLAAFSCDDDESKQSIRASIDYSVLDPKAGYSGQFKNDAGVTTVDLTDGNNRYKMFQALNYHSSSNITANTAIDDDKLSALFANSGSPFVDIATQTISVNGATLNSSGVQLKNVVATSQPSQTATVLNKFEADFDDIAEASLSLSQVAEIGKAGKLNNFLVNDRGIEPIQVIQKGLIGALQLDYIGNVLLNTGLDAENYELVDGKPYTQLEHNWDEAYAMFTLNQAYLYNLETGAATTDSKRETIEFGIGAYMWEYNKTGYPKIYQAFLIGRAAIVNNDRELLEAQATIIRTEMENAIANSAINYLQKWVDGADDAARAHAFAEGLGFIYSMRFATIHPADAAWSDGVINGLINSENGFWDLDVTKINTASNAIKAKFGLL
jgi:hypothetical protein